MASLGDDWRGAIREAPDIEAAGYVLGERLGEGFFAYVVAATHVESGIEYAAKVFTAAALADESAIDAVHMELATLQAARHASVVWVHELVRTPEATYLLMERLRGGELFDRMQRGPFHEDQARRILRELLVTVRHCHSVGVVHRDLKPENLLFVSDAEDAQLKLTDFGYAAILPVSGRLSGLSGTPDYVAPEILSWYSGRGVEYGSAADIWSVGVILYIMLCGYTPFYADDEEALVKKVRKAEVVFDSPAWENVSKSAKDLVSRCLALNPLHRPTAEAALSHPWLSPAPTRSHLGAPTTNSVSRPSHGAPALAPGIGACRPNGVGSSTHTHPHEEQNGNTRAPAQLLRRRMPFHSEELLAKEMATLQRHRTRVHDCTVVPEQDSTAAAQPIMMSLKGETARFQAPPSQESLAQKGAVFVTISTKLFQELYELTRARQSKQLDEPGIFSAFRIHGCARTAETSTS
mmetsp:Transcript_11383/g.24608  ORF Transcript_11383/g.24608 Transcript_11383/m.24608 type:complete len:465 (-) Transcript_11383:97-1491(-)